MGGGNFDTKKSRKGGKASIRLKGEDLREDKRRYEKRSDCPPKHKTAKLGGEAPIPPRIREKRYLLADAERGKMNIIMAAKRRATRINFSQRACRLLRLVKGERGTKRSREKHPCRRGEEKAPKKRTNPSRAIAAERTGYKARESMLRRLRATELGTGRGGLGNATRPKRRPICCAL